MNIKDIYINPKNPRYIKDDRFRLLVKNIKEFPKMMKLRPIIIDDNGMILGGNMRYLAMIDLGYKEIPEGWVVKASELTEEEKEKFKILDNVPFGNWDYDILANEWDMEKLQDWGIELPELENIELESKEDDFDVDKAIEAVKEPICKRGDIWQLGEHRLMCGDATVEEDVRRLMGGKKAGMVFTDPPYGIDLIKNNIGGMGFTHGKLSNKQKEKTMVDRKLYRNIIGDNKPFDPTFLLLKAKKVFIFGANNFSDKLPVSPHWLIWDKKNEGAERRNTFSDAELIWTNIKGISVKIYRWNWNGITRKGNRIDELITRCHPTQKPVGLLFEIIKDYTSDDEIILDLFGGSGSTLIACEKSNRKCFMMEIDPIYCDVIINRWEQYVNKKAVNINEKK